MRVDVQTDETANVVRLLVDETDDGHYTAYELPPTEALKLGPRIETAAESLLAPDSKFAPDPDDAQGRLDDIDDGRKPLSAVREEASDDPPDFGEVINDADPLEW